MPQDITLAELIQTMSLAKATKSVALFADNP